LRRRLVVTSSAKKPSLPSGDAKRNRLRQDCAAAEAFFCVDVQKSQEPVTLKFLVDDHTKTERKLNVGATAAVDYRTEDVTAVHIVMYAAA
jgi:hypothetical protein